MNLKETLEQMTPTQIVSDGDFTKDGLIHCGKCHTPKQARLKVGGQIIVMPCICQCEKEKLDAEEEARRKQEAMEKVKRMRRVGFADSEMENWTFEADDGKNKKLSNIAMNYVERFDEMKAMGKGLMLFGSVGTGKTFISACIANALIDRGHPCMVTNFSRLTNILFSEDNKQSYLDGLNKFDLLVIDDLASERDTEYMGEMVQSIIDARYRARKPLIVTTNLTGEELKHPTDIRKHRIYSRLLEMCVPVEVKGKDRRTEKLKSDYKDLEEVLGL